MVYHIPQAVDHDSMESLKMMDTDPIDLYQCLKAFVRDDELGEEECWSGHYTTHNSTRVHDDIIHRYDNDVIMHCMLYMYTIYHTLNA